VLPWGRGRGHGWDWTEPTGRLPFTKLLTLHKECILSIQTIIKPRYCRERWYNLLLHVLIAIYIIINLGLPQAGPDQPPSTPILEIMNSNEQEDASMLAEPDLVEEYQNVAQDPYL
jgi:hypothetical protein